MIPVLATRWLASGHAPSGGNEQRHFATEMGILLLYIAYLKLSLRSKLLEVNYNINLM